mmetsp:Transcript_15309/g.31734  ORF Transcript_15309/g.31734 Transcript_15309/m.31734 type:complete len:407 (-) Transcript_15309:178-1398(-)
MKSVAAVLFFSLQLTGSPLASVAAPDTSHIEEENIVQQRQRELREKVPLNEKEKVFLRQLVSENVLRYANDDSAKHSVGRRNLANTDDPLANAMRKSAYAKLEELRVPQQPAGGRNLQNFNYGSGGYGAGAYGYGAAGSAGAYGYGAAGGAGAYGYGVAGGAGAYGYGAAGGYGAYGYGATHNDGYVDDYYGGYVDDYNGNYADEAAMANMAHHNDWVPPPPKAEIPEKISMVLEAFQDDRRLQEPVKLTPETSFLNAGTQYLYANEPLYNVVWDVPPGANRGAYLVNERDRIAVASGTCIRTDPKTNYIGRAYCKFEYRFLDSQGNIEASLIAEGPVSKGDVSTLSITGGSGIFRRTVGTVVLETGRLRSGSPPMFIPNDNIDLPASYLVRMFVFMDSVDLELSS